MMYLSYLWDFTIQTAAEYFCFFLLDLWAKQGLKVAESDEKKRHIWVSEAQIIFVWCLIAYFCIGVYPVTLSFLGYICFRSSRPPENKSAVTQNDNKGASGIASQVQRLWLDFSVMIGDTVSYIFQKLRWNSHREHAAESMIWSAGSLFGRARFYISKCFSFLFSVLGKSIQWVCQNCTGWWDMLRNNQWDTYQYVSQEQVQGPSADISSDKLLCHPECELSQRNPCRISMTVSENHCSHSKNENHQIAGCYPVGTSMWTSAVKTQFDKFVALLQRIVSGAYYHLSQCRNIKLVPYSSESPGENLCFLNTVMYCFTKEPSMRKFLIEVVNEQSFLRMNLLEDEVHFLQSLHLLLTQSEGNDSVHLKQFIGACSKLIPSLISPPGCEQLQQDVVEFTQWLLNKLHHCCKAKKVTLFQKSSLLRNPLVSDQQELTTVLWKPKWTDRVKCSLTQPSDLLMKSMQRYAQKEWDSYRIENTSSSITHNFTGQMLDCYQCIMCNQISAQTQTFNILPLPLSAHSAELTLQQVIENFLNLEDMEVNEGCACTYSNWNSPIKTTSLEHSILGTPGFAFRSENSAKTSTPVSTGEAGLYDYDAQILSPIGLDIAVPKIPNKNQWYSSGINQVLKSRWLKRTFISQAPKYLIFQLLRCQFDNKSLTKNHLCVRIPLYKLYVPVMQSPGLLDQKPVTVQKEYELCAFIVHLGAKSVSCGHYVAYIRNFDHPTIWTKYDDTVVTKVFDIHSEMDSPTVKENAYLLFYRQTSFGG